MMSYRKIKNFIKKNKPSVGATVFFNASNVADYVTTYYCVSKGGVSGEQMPLAGLIIENFGFFGYGAARAAISASLLALSYYMRKEEDFLTKHHGDLGSIVLGILYTYFLINNYLQLL